MGSKTEPKKAGTLHCPCNLKQLCIAISHKASDAKRAKERPNPVWVCSLELLMHLMWTQRKGLVVPL